MDIHNDTTDIFRGFRNVNISRTMEIIKIITISALAAFIKIEINTAIVASLCYFPALLYCEFHYGFFAAV
jgi:hypothetical protein